MHQPIVIGPTADAGEPRFKQFEFSVAKLRVEFLQQEDCGDFFFQNQAIEEMIGDLDEKIEPALFSKFSSKADGRAAQVGCIPAMRFDFIFEKPLHAGGVFNGPTIFERTANLGSDLGSRACEMF